MKDTVPKHLTIECVVSQDTLDKFLLYYPSKQDIADEIMRQIADKNALMTGETVNIVYRKYKGQEDKIR